MLDVRFYAVVTFGRMMLDDLFHMTMMLGTVAIDVLYHPAMMFGPLMINVLFHQAFRLMVPSVMPVPLMVAIVPLPVRITFALFPAIMMTWRVLVLVMVNPFVWAPSIPFFTICPGVAA